MEIIKIPLINSMGKTNGCEKAPDQIVEALKDIKSNENFKTINFDGLEIDKVQVDNYNLEESLENISEKANGIFENNKRVIFLGGDHSISYPVCKAFMKSEENPFLILFDAHADCCNPGKEPTHEEWLRKLVEEGFNPENIVIISARNLFKEEIEFIKQKKIQIIKTQNLNESLEIVCDAIMEKARNSSGFYISIDIDCLDPCYAPGTGYLEPNGLTSRELFYFIKRLIILENFKAGDIVEINPEKDVNNITLKLGAKILSEMI